MSKLNDLIKNLCPRGVEFKKLGELGKFYGGLNGKSKKDFNNGNSKFITYMNVYKNIELKIDIDDKVFIDEKEKQNLVKYGDVLFTGSSETREECGISSVLTVHSDEKIYLNSFCFGFRFNDSKKFLPGFTKYLFRSENLRQQIVKTASGVTRFNVSKNKMENILIPIPSLEIQKEIVRILDTFTELIEKLSEELSLRKKQYEFYREKLLTFGDEVEFKTISSVADSFTGLTYKPTDKSESGIIVLRSSNIKNSRLTFDDCVFVKMDKIPERALAKENDILVCVRNGSKELIGKAALIPHTENQMAFGAFMTILRAKSEINYRFLFYIWQSRFVQNKFHSDNAMPINQITKKDFDLIKIPIPPLEVQKEIVRILDKFTELIEKLSEEITLRKKQYEFYRDKLFTFEEAQN